MLYRNKKTGVVIDFKSPISGENWEPIKVVEEPKKKKAVKKDGDRK